MLFWCDTFIVPFDFKIFVHFYLYFDHSHSQDVVYETFGLIVMNWWYVNYFCILKMKIFLIIKIIKKDQKDKNDEKFRATLMKNGREK